MPIEFDIPTYVNNTLPQQYRLPKFILFVQQALSQLAWRWGVFKGYRDGEATLPYSAGTTYGAGNRVQWNFATYESLQGSNTGNTPDTSPLFWIMRNANFIGATERAKYGCGYLQLTYQLNRYFGTTFRQPPYPGIYGGSGTFSDIYITNQALTYVSFVSYTTETLTSKVYTTGTGGSDVFTVESYGSASTYQFIVHIPTAVFTALGATTAIRTSIVNRFIALYVPSGIGWSIVTY